MKSPVPQITRGNEPVIRELLLQGQAPLLHVHRFRMEREISQTAAKRRECRRCGKLLRQGIRITAWEVEVRIRKTADWCRDVDGSAPWRVRAALQKQRRDALEHTVTDADRLLPFPARVI